MLSEASIAKFAIDNKLEKKADKNDGVQDGPNEEINIAKGNADTDAQDSGKIFAKYSQLFKENSVFSEYGTLLHICPRVVRLSIFWKILRDLQGNH